MKEKVKGFIMGTAFCSMLMGTTAYALEPTAIEVYFRSIKYMFDGVEKMDSGNRQGLIYNGTTYVPLRFVSESLEKKVEWDEENNTIWIGKRTEGSVYLSDIKYARASGGGISNTAYGNVNNIAGKMYKNNGLRLVLPTEASGTLVTSKSGVITYNLDANYSRFTGLVGIDDSYKNSKSLGSIRIVGDGKELFSNTGLKSGDNPKLIDINVKNVSSLELQFERDDQDGLALDLVEGILYY